MRIWLAAAAVALLYLLHQDFWFWREARPLVFGVLPIGLFYHVAFTFITSLVLLLLVKVAWPAHLEGPSTSLAAGPSTSPGTSDE
jgi:hypothetical protein